MEYLTKTEKKVIDYLCESEIFSEKENFKVETNGSIQYNEGSFQHMILIMFRDDICIKQVGLEVCIDMLNNIETIFVTEPENRESVIFGNYFAFQRVNYYLNKIPRFMYELEKMGYIDKINLGYIYGQTSRNFPLQINHKDYYRKTLEIKDKSLVKDFIECLNYYYVPTLKLREYKKNHYKTAQKVKSESDALIANQNIRIAKSGLFISVISAICSLVAIIVTIFNTQEVNTFKFDNDQMNSIREIIQMEKDDVLKVDTAVLKQ